MKYRWSIAPPQPVLAADLAARIGIHPLLALCLVNRAVCDKEAGAGFLEPRLKHLSDPFLLPGMSAAVERLLLAHRNQESLVIFGDYDVDGVTSTALLVESMSKLGWTVHSYLPHRMEEGYGLTREAAENCLKKHQPSLVLAVDCGSTSVKTIDWLKASHVDVIVLDHHQVSYPAPEACALVNPRVQKTIPGTTFDALPPFGELCSVGLSFKLVHALVKRGREANMTASLDFDLRPLLDLVALGTVADIVPLTGENRILVAAGLERLSTTQRPGLVALKRIAQSPLVIGVREIGFQLAPRLNAAGRLETAEDSLRLLLAPTLAEALCLAERLDAQNRDRQQIERRILDDALDAVRARFNPAKDFVIVEGQPPWHIGVVGIVAARVLQQFYRPTIILGGDGPEWRGSGRSIEGFDLAAALHECSGLLVRHGGHAMAAGITLLPSNLDSFRSRLNEVAGRLLSPDFLQPPLRLDAEIPLKDLSIESLSFLEKLKPFGQGNPGVQFCSRQLRHCFAPQRMGTDKQHVKLRVADDSATHETVWWNAGDAAIPEGVFDLAYAPQINDYNGRRNVQLRWLDWRQASATAGL